MRRHHPRDVSADRRVRRCCAEDLHLHVSRAGRSVHRRTVEVVRTRVIPWHAPAGRAVPKAERDVNYADRLAEFVKVTGHRPGEMNKPTIADAINQLAQQLGLGECDATHDGGIVNGVPFGILASKSRLTAADHAKLISFDDSSFPSLDELLSIEPPAQSAGPGCHVGQPAAIPRIVRDEIALRVPRARPTNFARRVARATGRPTRHRAGRDRCDRQGTRRWRCRAPDRPP